MSKKNLLTKNDVENDVSAFDGGDCDNPPIQLKSSFIFKKYIASKTDYFMHKRNYFNYSIVLFY
jgi:hypothetical protein